LNYLLRSNMDEEKDNIEKIAEHLIRMEYKAVKREIQQNETRKGNDRKKDESAVEKKVPASNYLSSSSRAG
jgi:replication initiation and membrane attachment protein DnaB